MVSSTLGEALSASATLGPAGMLSHLVAEGFDRLPLPGSGQTLARWRTLAAVGGHDLALAKLFEGHTDAMAILAELGAPSFPANGIWATWAAEPPEAKVTVAATAGHLVSLRGTKAWCSGASVATHAVLTAWDAQGRQQLFAVDLDQQSITRHTDAWQAVGMASTNSAYLRFHGTLAHPLGQPGDYVGRPGFWHGGAGVAACWLGAAQWLGNYLREHMKKSGGDPHRRAHLGEVYVALEGAAATMRALAAQIDANPAHSWRVAVMHARLQVEAACDTVIRHVGRALGATPFCTDRHFARLMADLPVFIRQSHAERDLASLGEAVSEEGAPTWVL